MKSALRIYLSVSYVMKSITSISHLRWLFPPLVPYGTTFPPRWEGGGASRQRRYKKMAPKAPYLPSGTVLYTSRGRSPQPVREASAGPGQNPWRPGPKARRRHQPSRRSRVNLREYWKAPPKPRSRSRPRREAPEPSSPIGACPYEVSVTGLSFCVIGASVSGWRTADSP